MLVVGILTINHPGERKDEHLQAPKVNASKGTLRRKNSWESNTHVILQTCHDHLCNHHNYMDYSTFAYEHTRASAKKITLPTMQSASDPMESQEAAETFEPGSCWCGFLISQHLCVTRCDWERRDWPQFVALSMWEICIEKRYEDVKQTNQTRRFNHIMGN